MKTTDGQILLAVKTSDNSSDTERFFYDDIIEISRPLIIDNEEILRTLNTNRPLIIHGKYSVYELRNNIGELIKYIEIR